MLKNTYKLEDSNLSIKSMEDVACFFTNIRIYIYIWGPISVSINLVGVEEFMSFFICTLSLIIDLVGSKEMHLVLHSGYVITLSVPN